MISFVSSAKADEALSSFFESHCTSCHNPERRKGKFDLTPLIERMDLADADSLANILEMITEGEMPPDEEPRPTDNEIQSVKELLQPLIAKAKFAAAAQATSPGQGNLVNHKSLFTEPDVRKAATSSRIWRMSPHQFTHRANGLSRTPLLRAKRNQGGDGLHPAFAYMTPAHTFRDHAEAHAFEEATTELLFDVCWQIGGIQANSDRMAAPIKLMQNKKSPDRVDWKRLVRMQFSFALHRQPTAEEEIGLVRLGETTFKKTKRTRESMQTVLAAVLLKPDAVYRFEIGMGEPDEHGRVMLTPYELMYAISFALTDKNPDELLQSAVSSGELSNKIQAKKQVDRLLSSNAVDDRMLRFFQEYFEYTRSKEIFKDARRDNMIFANDRIDDADLLVNHILAEDRDVLKRLLTEERLYVMEKGIHTHPTIADRTRRFYFPDFGMPSDWDGKSAQPLKPENGRRSGMLTHPAWLLAFSDNEKNQAIQRGRWVQMKLLGGPVPETPIGVDATLPTDPHLTLREKMKVTTEAYCWKCHQRMDPLGLPFEQFDDFGRYRSQELDKPVVTKGNIDIGISDLDGAVSDPFELMQRLATSEHVEQVFIRHVFRYFLGRNETVDDAPSLIDAHNAYRESGGGMKSLVSSLLTSDSFLMRKVNRQKETNQQ